MKTILRKSFLLLTTLSLAPLAQSAQESRPESEERAYRQLLTCSAAFFYLNFDGNYNATLSSLIQSDGIKARSRFYLKSKDFAADSRRFETDYLDPVRRAELKTESGADYYSFVEAQNFEMIFTVVLKNEGKKYSITLKEKLVSVKDTATNKVVSGDERRRILDMAFADFADKLNSSPRIRSFAEYYKAAYVFNSQNKVEDSALKFKQLYWGNFCPTADSREGNFKSLVQTYWNSFWKNLDDTLALHIGIGLRPNVVAR